MAIFSPINSPLYKWLVPVAIIGSVVSIYNEPPKPTGVDACFRPDNGVPFGLKGKLGDQINDPASFEAISGTHFTPNHTFIVTFRARNGFGGMVVQRLYGKIDDNCNISGVEDDQQIADEFKQQ
ncbi:hypothetical protein [Novosphingobium sp. FSW06-99]|uniref:hypothetical protein n=1 Tax=Novosphingobium sp. FSW06-99 TaxID=1739113 RepID=UPI000A95CD73|nr:hypothetical protein [Novosphingobium sp. FSW06-99]